MKKLTKLKGLLEAVHHTRPSGAKKIIVLANNADFDGIRAALSSSGCTIERAADAASAAKAFMGDKNQELCGLIADYVRFVDFTRKMTHGKLPESIVILRDFDANSEMDAFDQGAEYVVPPIKDSRTAERLRKIVREIRSTGTGKNSLGLR